MKRRYNIGLVVSDVMENFNKDIIAGAMEAAKKNDCNLFVIPGKTIDEDYAKIQKDENNYEYQHNALYSYINETDLDYIAVTVCNIAYASDKARKKMFMDSLGDIPKISIATEIEGYDCVKFDNEESIIQAVSFLVKKHCVTKIGMLSGYESNEDASERFNAYKKALSLNGIEYDKRRVIFANISRFCKNEAQQLIETNPDIQAIICANDDMAITLYSVLKEKGYEIGSDIYVVGFDNLPASSKLEPPLASINASAEDLGHRAIENCIASLEGRELDKSNVKTQFLPRKSCGGSEKLFSSPNIFTTDTNDIIVTMIIEYISSEKLYKKNNEHLYSVLKDTIDMLKMFLKTETVSRSVCEKIIYNTESFISQFDDYYNYIDKLYSIVDVCYKNIISQSITDENRAAVDELYTNMYKRLSIMIAGSVEKLIEESEHFTHKTNVLVRDILMFASNRRDMYATVLNKMSYLGVESSYIFTLPKPVEFCRGKDFPLQSRFNLMSYQLGGSVFSVSKKRRAIYRDNLYSNDFMPDVRRYTMIVSDLYSAEFQYGLFFCELDVKHLKYLEFLTYQFSTAVKIIELLRAQEANMNLLYENNAELDSISKLDELTGLFNRRGFFNASNSVLSNPINHNKYAVVVFCDLDYLKNINDKYGHVEGDFAIKSVGEVLKKIFRSSDIIGRIGGDEFVILAIVSNPDFEIILRQRKKEHIDKLNAEVSKPYRINMSMGIYQCRCDEITSINEVVDKADDLLYTEKKNRSF